jgi:hypothetical protein
MKCKGQVLWLVTAAILCGGLSGPARSDGRRGAATVRFVRLTEKRVERQERLAMVVRQLDGEETTILVLPAKGEPRDVARKLREGQVITVGYVTEAGAVWVTRIQRREGDREREGQDRGREGDRDRDEGAAEEGRDRDGDAERPDRGEKDDREGQGRRDGDRGDAEEGRGRRDREAGEEGRGDRDRRDREEGEARQNSREVRQALRRLLERIESLEVRVKQLEEQNAALRKALRGE